MIKLLLLLVVLYFAAHSLFIAFESPACSNSANRSCRTAELNVLKW